MKWYAALPLLALAALPLSASGQTIRTVSIGNIARVDDNSPKMWGMSGMDIFKVSRTVNGFTPIMRTEVFDARTVEILSRTQAPPLRPSDVRAVSRNGRHFVVVRNYLLAEVMPEDARSEGASPAAVAEHWASRVRRVLPQVAPVPNRFGT